MMPKGMLFALVICAFIVSRVRCLPGGYSARSHNGHSSEEHRYPPMDYKFAYEVKDPKTTNFQNRFEVSENGKVRGSYSLLAPDGVLRTTIYSDNGYGYKAVLHEEPTNIKVIGSGGYRGHSHRSSSEEFSNEHSVYFKPLAARTYSSISLESESSEEVSRYLPPPSSSLRSSYSRGFRKNFGHKKGISFQRRGKSSSSSPVLVLNKDFLNSFGLSRNSLTNNQLVGAVRHALIGFKKKNNRRRQQGYLHSEQDLRSEENDDVDFGFELNLGRGPDGEIDFEGLFNSLSSGNFFSNEIEQNDNEDRGKQLEVQQKLKLNDAGENERNQRIEIDVENNGNSVDQNGLVQEAENLGEQVEAENIQEGETEANVENEGVNEAQGNNGVNNFVVSAQGGIPIIGIDKALFDSLSLPGSTFTQSDLIREIQGAIRAVTGASQVNQLTENEFTDNFEQNEQENIVKSASEIVINQSSLPKFTELSKSQISEQFEDAFVERNGKDQEINTENEKQLNDIQESSISNNNVLSEFSTTIPESLISSSKGGIPIIAIGKPFFDSFSLPGSSMTQSDLVQAIQTSWHSTLTPVQNVGDSAANKAKISGGKSLESIPIEGETNSQITNDDELASVLPVIAVDENLLGSLTNAEVEKLIPASPLTTGSEVLNTKPEILDDIPEKSEIKSSDTIDIIQDDNQILDAEPSVLQAAESVGTPLFSLNQGLSTINQTLLESLQLTDEPSSIDNLIQALQNALSTLGNQSPSTTIKPSVSTRGPALIQRRAKVKNLDIPNSKNPFTILASPSSHSFSVVPGRRLGGFKSFANSHSQFNNMINRMIGPVIEVR